MTAGFWKAARRLAQMLAERELTPNEYMLVHVVAECGADWPDGFVTTNQFLASTLGVHEKTVRRALQSLRAHGLISYNDHERVAVFTIRTTAHLRTLEGVSMSAPVSAPLSAGSADTPTGDQARKPAQRNAEPPVVSADSRARALEKEKEKEKNPTGALTRTPAPAVRDVSRPERGDIGAQQLVAYYVDRARELGAEPPRRVVGQVAQQLGQLTGEGFDEQTLAAALELMLERRLHPSVLPSLVVEAQAGPARPRGREHVADRLLRSALHDGRGLEGAR